MFIRLKRAFGIFSNLWKTFGAGPKPKTKAEELIEVAWPFESHIFWWMFAERNCKVSVSESYLAQELGLFQKKFQTMQTFHFEVLVRDECIEFFQIYHRTISPILLSYKKNVAQKLLLSCFCFLNSSLLQLWYFLVH